MRFTYIFIIASYNNFNILGLKDFTDLNIDFDNKIFQGYDDMVFGSFSYQSGSKKEIKKESRKESKKSKKQSSKAKIKNKIKSNPTPNIEDAKKTLLPTIQVKDDELSLNKIVIEILDEQTATQTITPTPQEFPTSKPFNAKTDLPTVTIPAITDMPITKIPTIVPTKEITNDPTKSPTDKPTTSSPTSNPSAAPTTAMPINAPTIIETNQPSLLKSQPTLLKTNQPSSLPTSQPSFLNTTEPTSLPTNEPSLLTSQPTLLKTNRPSLLSTSQPTLLPTGRATLLPTSQPTLLSTFNPTLRPTRACEWSKKSFLENSKSDRIIYNTEIGVISPGDYNVWNNELTTTDGHTQGYCTFLPELVLECTVTINLKDDGKIQLQGSFLKNPDKLAVVGGTGCYKSVRGGQAVLESAASGDGAIYHVQLQW